MAVDGKAITAVIAGGVLMYSGVKGMQISKVAQDLIKGQNPSDDSGASGASGSSALTPGGTATSNQSVNVAGIAKANCVLGKTLAATFGWSVGKQWNALDQLWGIYESGWSNTALNASGAYGIAQALPSSKYPLPGRPPADGGVSDPTTQILWGLAYIKSRYGNPVNALQFELTNHYY